MKHIERYWQKLTVDANDLFAGGDLDRALTAYRTAMVRAEILCKHIPECLKLKIPFIQVYIISCNNMAFTYERLGIQEEAEAMLKQAVYFLLKVSNCPQLNFEEIQSELRKATLAYMQVLQKSKAGEIKQQQLYSKLNEELSDCPWVRLNLN